MEPLLRISSPKEEGVLQVSKWLKTQVLLSEEEMGELIAHLPVHIYLVSEPTAAPSGWVSKEDFLKNYTLYVEQLKCGAFPDETPLRKYFSAIFTSDPSVLYAMPVGKEKFLIKALKPVIQLQLHHFFYSTVDKKFHPMVLSQESVSWGIQFSYPQIYQHPKTLAFSKVGDQAEFPNTSCFLHLMKWMRKHTLPTPIEAEGKKAFIPIRIGKKCFSWIDNHPGLSARNLKIIPPKEVL